MCEICRSSPCLSRCPNASEPEGVFTCEECGEKITVGEEYVEIDGTVYCTNCIDNMTTEEIVKLFGGSYKTAEESDIDDGSDDAYEAWRDERLFDECS